MEKAVVFYADILGFKELANKNNYNDDLLEEMRKAIQSGIGMISSLKTIFKSFQVLSIPSINYKLFSKWFINNDQNDLGLKYIV